VQRRWSRAFRPGISKGPPYRHESFQRDGGFDVSKARFVTPIVGFALFFGALSVRAESSWNLPNLNPFSKSSAKSESKKDSGFFKLPDWNWFGKEGKKETRKQEPSAWDRVTSSTKRFFAKSKEALTPGKSGKKRGGYSSVRERYNVTDQNDSGESKSFFSSWFSKDEEPEQPRTVSEFLAQPRP
jgi:hypothetical protein